VEDEQGRVGFAVFRRRGESLHQPAHIRPSAPTSRGEGCTRRWSVGRLRMRFPTCCSFCATARSNGRRPGRSLLQNPRRAAQRANADRARGLSISKFQVPPGPLIITRHFSRGDPARRDTRAAGTSEMPPKPDNYFNRSCGTEINSVQDPALRRRATVKRSYGTRSPELRLLLNICVRMVSDKSSLQSLRLLSKGDIAAW
jgi:hypothetical protein